MITALLTVTHGRELHMQKLQSRSLDLYLAEPIDHHVIIEDDYYNKDIWYRNLEKFYSRHRLWLWHHSEFHVNGTNGFMRQQQLKIKCAAQISQPRVLVLDSKDFLINELTLDFHTWGNSDRYMQPQHLTAWSSSIDWIKSQPELANIDLERLWWPHTPCMIDRTVCQRIIELWPDCECISDHSCRSEFILISAMAQDYEVEHDCRQLLGSKLWGTHKLPQFVSQTEKTPMDFDVTWLSIHRRTWSRDYYYYMPKILKIRPELEEQLRELDQVRVLCKQYKSLMAKRYRHMR